MRIFIAGWFGAGNVGDDAILLAMLDSLSATFDHATFDVLSFDLERSCRLLQGAPRVSSLVYVGSSRTFHRTDFLSLLRTLRKADLVLVGGGGLFQDLYNCYFPPFFGAVVLTAKLLRKPTVIFGVGVGPLNTWLGRNMTRIATRLSDLIVVRDDPSADELYRLGVRERIHVTADLVLLLHPSPPERGRALLRAVGVAESRHPLVGVMVQDLLPWEDCRRQVLAAVLDHVIENWGGHIVFVPFGQYFSGANECDKTHGVDYACTVRLRDLVRHKAETSILLGEDSPCDLMAAIGQFDLAISMRYHGLVMATAMGVPCIALTYADETKLRSFMTRVASPHDVLDVQTLTRSVLEPRIDDALAHVDERHCAARQRASALTASSRSSSQLLAQFARDFPSLSAVVTLRRHRAGPRRTGGN